jgi:hypothetical protein
MSNMVFQSSRISTSKSLIHGVRFQFLTAASMKMAVFWVVALCNLVEFYRRFRDAYSLHHQGDRPDYGGNIPEDSQLPTRRLENLKSHLNLINSG